jgi:adenosine deaminase
MGMAEGEGKTVRGYWPEIVLVVLLVVLAISVSVGLGGDVATPTAGERRATQAFADAEALGAPGLYALLRDMPKGGDLHMHLTGAVYAETFIKDAVADGMCVDVKALSFVKSAGALQGARRCAEGQVAAASVYGDQKLYDELVNSFSMRSYFPTPGFSGHDQFFATFDRDDPQHDMGARHGGEWLDEVATRAAGQNEQYLEVMQTPSTATGAAFGLGNKFGWPVAASGAVVDPLGDAAGTSREELSALRTKLLAGGIREETARERKELDGAMADRERMEHCGQVDAAKACGVKIRWLYQVLRAFPPQVVFAQTLVGFEIANADPDVVGINFVQPEDAMLAMSEYNRQMHMLDYLHSAYPRVHISLHAGELAVGLVPPAGLRFHIREAIDVGHAERIGHGVDVMEENDGAYLMRMMAKRHVMVEVNLTSNDVILGVKGEEHPLAAYMAAGVPVALSTDDEGVSRIDLTHEYVRAAMEQHVGYMDLKAMARTSMEHSFLPGESLWAKRDVFTRMKPVCKGARPGVKAPAQACKALLDGSERAAEEWELERRFAVFERNVH